MNIPNAPEGENEHTKWPAAMFEDYEKAIKSGDVKAAEAATLSVWQHLAENPDPEPSPWLEAMQQAHQCEAVFDWPGAEKAYQCAAQAAADQPALRYSAYRELSQFHRLFDRETLALETTRLATEAARACSISSQVVLALQAEAAFHLRAKDHPAAWKLISEAFATLEEGPMHNLPRVFALLARIDYAIEQERFAEAEADLTAAWTLLEPWSESHYAGGWQGGFAGWWSSTARLRSKRGDKSGAIAACQEAVARRRIIAGLPQLEGPYKHNSLAIALRDLGRALQAGEDPSAAESFAESRSIRSMIGLPPLEN